MLKWILRNKYAKFDRNIPCGLRFMSIYTNWPLPAWLMLGITLSAKRNFYACQCLDTVEMYMYAKFDQTIPSLSYEHSTTTESQPKNGQQRKLLDCLIALWCQIFALDSAGSLLKTNVLSSNRGFIIYAIHYHRGTNYQWFSETKKMAHRELELKSI